MYCILYIDMMLQVDPVEDQPNTCNEFPDLVTPLWSEFTYWKLGIQTYPNSPVGDPVKTI